MLVNGGRHTGEPVPIFAGFQQVGRRKELDPVLRWIAQRLDEFGRDQCRNVVQLAVQQPSRLFRRQAGGQLAQEHQKSVLIIAHCSSSLRAFNLGIGILQAIPSGPPPARRCAPGRWSTLPGPISFSHAAIVPAFLFVIRWRIVGAAFFVHRGRFYSALNATPLRPEPPHHARRRKGSFISNATRAGNHLVMPRHLRNLPVFSCDLAATSGPH
jgi:hypothetical protein